MSEYQYYEFLAVDRPLTPRQIKEVGKFSSRADISSTRFVNEYNWGDFRGNVDDFLTRFFDVMVYVANWGTHRLAMGLPADLVNVEQLERYSTGDASIVKVKKDRVVVDLMSQEEEPADWEEGEGRMDSLAPVRDELLQGDMRPLYLAWLSAISEGTVYDDDDDGDDDDEVEPPVPPGLNSLSPAQESLAEFLRVHEDLLTVAAQASADAVPASDQVQALRQWIAGLPESEKNESMLSLLTPGSEAQSRAKLLHQFRLSQKPKGSTDRSQTDDRRTIRSLRAAAMKLHDERKAAERARREQQRRRHEAAKAAERAKYLRELAGRQPQTWEQIDQLIQQKSSQTYEQAVELLKDLRDVAVSNQAMSGFVRQLADLRAAHVRKINFVERLDRTFKVPTKE